MKLLVDWFNDYLTKELPAELIADALERAGVEVEEIIHSPKFDSKIVTAEVISVAKHPSADKLNLVIVDSGHGLVEVVCGAPNVTSGQKVVLAQVGSILPQDVVIKATEIRGVMSHGMLCSEQELGLGTNHDGILELANDIPVGLELVKLYKHSSVIDVTTAANRPDLQSIIGLVREVSAHTGINASISSIVESNTTILDKVKKNTLFANKIPKIAPCYLLAKFTLVDTMPKTPPYIKERLQLSGVKPINFIVDITNYTMLETGQPLHAFDAGAINDEIVIRWAKKGEILTTLDNKERTLDTEDIVIADKKNAIALAGIMGGKDSEVNEHTKTILLESAVFDGTAIRKSALRQGIRTEASSRFERGLPIENPYMGIRRAFALIRKHSSVSIEQFQESCAVVQKIQSIKISCNDLYRLMSVRITTKKVKDYLSRLNIKVNQITSDKLLVTTPFWRSDLKLPEDIYEELIKFIGLEKVPSTLPLYSPTGFIADTYWSKLFQLRSSLIAGGLFEVSTYPFISEQQLIELKLDNIKHLELKNPRSLEQKYFRSSLVPNLLAAVSHNKDYSSQFALFEFATVFESLTKRFLPKECERLGIIYKTDQESYRYLKKIIDNIIKLTHIPDVKFTVTDKEVSYLHPHRQTTILAGGNALGIIGEIDPRISIHYKLKSNLAYAELDLLNVFRLWQEPVYNPVSRYQTIKRDLTFTVNKSVTWQAVEEALTGSLGVKVKYVDDYSGPKTSQAKKSLTIRLEFSSLEKTLTDREAGEQLNKVQSILKDKFSATF